MSLNSACRILKSARQSIVEAWLTSDALQAILLALRMSAMQYRQDVAEPVFDYLLEMLEIKGQKPDCPAMRKLVETFLNSDMHSEDVFLNCTGFKNIVIDTLYGSDAEVQQIRVVSEIMDRNLYEILKIYSREKMLQDRRYHFHAKLIEEHLAMSKTDPQGIITYVTDAYCTLSGYASSELIGRSHAILRHEAMPDAFFAEMWQALNTRHKWSGVIKNRTKDGGEFVAKTDIIPFFDEAGELLEYIAIRHDITDQMLSNIDPLTELYNRRYLMEHLDTVLHNYTETALMMVDIDHFKQINDAYGHLFGDEVLKQVAQLLQAATREQDICVRWGGEEFMVLLPQCTLSAAQQIAERIRHNTSELLLTEKNSGDSVKVQCSVGVSVQRRNEVAEALIERVDRKLYEAKNNGRNRVIAG